MKSLRNIRFVFYPELAMKALKDDCSDLLIVYLAIKEISRLKFDSKDVLDKSALVKIVIELLQISETRARQFLHAGDGRFWRIGKKRCGLVSYTKVFQGLIEDSTLPSSPISLSLNDLCSRTSMRPSIMLKNFVYACAVGSRSEQGLPITKLAIAQLTGLSERTIVRLGQDNPFLNVLPNVQVIGNFINPLTAAQFCKDRYATNKGVFVLHARQWASVVKRLGNSFELIGFDRLEYYRRPKQLKALCSYRNCKEPPCYKLSGVALTRHGKSQIWEPREAAEMADDERLLKVEHQYV